MEDQRVLPLYFRTDKLKQHTQSLPHNPYRTLPTMAMGGPFFQHPHKQRYYCRIDARHTIVGLYHRCHPVRASCLCCKCRCMCKVCVTVH